MEDMMHIQSNFVRQLIAAAARKALKKIGCKADICLYEFHLHHKDDGKVTVHLDMTAEMSESDLIDILKKAGVV